MPVVPSVGIWALHKDACLTLTLGVHFPSDVEQVDTSPNVPSGVLDLLVAMDVGEQAQAEPVLGAGVGEPVDSEAGLGGLEDLPHSVLHLVVADHTPVCRLCVRDGMVVSCRKI